MLARDVAAGVALPGFDNSAMDGYAARWAEVAGRAHGRRSGCRWPRTSRPVAPTSSRWQPGTVHRIMTGAPMPAGADVVVPVELTDGGTDEVEIRDAPAPGSHLRRGGRGHRRRARVALSAGTPLGAAQLGLAAAVGVTTLPVRRPTAGAGALDRQRARRARASRCVPGQIYESNSALLAAAVEDAGGEARRLHFVPDDVDQFLTTVRGRAGDGATC